MSTSEKPNGVLSSKTIDYIESLRKKYNVKGISVSVVQRFDDPNGGEVKWRTETPCFGVFDREDTPMGPNNMFIMASSSKIFTVMGIGILIERKTKLSNGSTLQWTTKIKDVLPEWKLQDAYATDHVEIEDLLCKHCWKGEKLRVAMRWGMPGHQSIGGKLDEDMANIVGELQYLKMNSEIRKHFQYCNHGFSTAGVIISRLSGKKYADFIRDEILSPLKMDSSGYDAEGALNSGKRIQGWHRFNKDSARIKEMVKNGKWEEEALGQPVPVPFWSQGSGEWYIGCGGLWTTANDMIKWQKELLDPKILPKHLVEEIVKPRMITFMDPGPPHPEFSPQLYGLGQFIEHYRGHQMIQHGGGIPGYYTCNIRLPKDDIALTLNVNDEGFGPSLNYILGLRIVDDLLGFPPIDWEERRVYKSLTLLPDYGTLPEPPRPPLGSERIVGEYSHPGYGKVKIVKLQDHPLREIWSLLFTQEPIRGLPGVKGDQQLYIGDTDQLPEVVGRILFIPCDGPIYTTAFIKAEEVLPWKERERVIGTQSHIGGMWNVGKAVFKEDGFGMFENFWWEGATAPSSTLTEDNVKEEAEAWYDRI